MSIKKWNSDYEVNCQYNASGDVWFVEDSDGNLAFGETYLEAWSNLYTAYLNNPDLKEE